MTISEVIQNKYGPQTAHGYDRLAYNCFWAYKEAFEAAAYSLYAFSRPTEEATRNILDVGAGTGNGSIAITQKFNELEIQMDQFQTQFSFTLFDQSSSMLNKAIEKLQGKNTKKIVNPIELLSESVSSEFDFVFSSYFFHNLNLPQKNLFIDSVFKVTKKGGSFILIDRFLIDEKNLFGSPAYLKAYTIKFYNDAKVSSPKIQFKDVQDEIQKNFEFENDTPSNLLDTMTMLQDSGFEVSCPFVSFGIGVIHAFKPD